MSEVLENDGGLYVRVDVVREALRRVVGNNLENPAWLSFSSEDDLCNDVFVRKLLDLTSSTTKTQSTSKRKRSGGSSSSEEEHPPKKPKRTRRRTAGRKLREPDKSISKMDLMERAFGSSDLSDLESESSVSPGPAYLGCYALDHTDGNDPPILDSLDGSSDYVIANIQHSDSNPDSLNPEVLSLFEQIQSSDNTRDHSGSAVYTLPFLKPTLISADGLDDIAWLAQDTQNITDNDMIASLDVNDAVNSDGSQRTILQQQHASAVNSDFAAHYPVTTDRQFEPNQSNPSAVSTIPQHTFLCSPNTLCDICQNPSLVRDIINSVAGDQNTKAPSLLDPRKLLRNVGYLDSAALLPPEPASHILNKMKDIVGFGLALYASNNILPHDTVSQHTPIAADNVACHVQHLISMDHNPLVVDNFFEPTALSQPALDVRH